MPLLAIPLSQHLPEGNTQSRRFADFYSFIFICESAAKFLLHKFIRRKVYTDKLKLNKSFYSLVINDRENEIIYYAQCISIISTVVSKILSEVDIPNAIRQGTTDYLVSLETRLYQFPKH